MLATTSRDRLQELIPQLFQPVDVSGDSYLRFQLTPKIPALFPMESIEEAILVPVNLVTPIPSMPPAFIGLLNSQNHVFCIVDLCHLLGFSPLPANLQAYQVVVINFTKKAHADVPQWLGFAVPRVSGLIRFQSEALQTEMQDYPTELAPYILGNFVIADTTLRVLDVQAIASTPALLTNPFILP
jgi:twitching motility protein PilI